MSVLIRSNGISISLRAMFGGDASRLAAMATMRRLQAARLSYNHGFLMNIDYELSSHSPSVRTSSIAIRIVIALLATGCCWSFLAFDVWFYRAVRAALPQVDGTVAVAGLSQPVTVTRDSLGVPTITAANARRPLLRAGLRHRAGAAVADGHDAALRLGRSGGNSGPGLRRGRQGAAHSGPASDGGEVRRRDGPGAARAVPGLCQRRERLYRQHTKTLPMEFRFLTYAPHVWTVEDSLLVGLSMTEFLNHGYYREALLKEKALAKLGPELTAELFVNSSWRDHPPGAEGKSLADEPPQNLPEGEDFAVPSAKPAPRKGLSSRHGSRWFCRLRRPASSLSPEVRYHAGSNNWVISGAHTASGKPLLSNDMHLELRLPNNWYEAHLVCGDFDVAGVTLPGMPYVIVGHNRHVAWGFTNVGPAVEDVFIEKFNDKGEYLTPQGWVQPEHRQEIIRVKGKPEVKFDVVVTRHGPIITSLVPGETRQLALQWIIYKPGSSKIPFFEVNSAKNWDEFRAAFSTLRRAGAKRGLCRRGWPHRLPGDGIRSDSRVG